MTKQTRIHIAIPEDLLKRLDHQIPPGFRSEICRKAIELCVDAMEEHGPGVAGFILSKRIRFVADKDRQNLTVSE